jgi:hypothetical protein
MLAFLLAVLITLIVGGAGVLAVYALACFAFTPRRPPFR